MSGRGFKFGDRVEYEGEPAIVIGLIEAMEEGDGDEATIILQRSGEELQVDVAGLWMVPSAQPHVVAGRGWKERMHEAIQTLVYCAQDECSEGLPFADADALLAEVVELPEPTEYKAVKMNNGLIGMVDLGLFLEREEALQLAAALIRAATSGPGKAEP